MNNDKKAKELAGYKEFGNWDTLNPDAYRAAIKMAEWKDELIEKFHHHAHSMYTEMMNLSTDASGIRKAMEDYKHFLFTEYYTDDE